MSDQIFKSFVKVLKSLWIFDLIAKKNSYQLQNILKNFEFSIVCINHNK